jgi:hypothetical protein
MRCKDHAADPFMREDLVMFSFRGPENHPAARDLLDMPTLCLSTSSCHRCEGGYRLCGAPANSGWGREVTMSGGRHSRATGMQATTEKCFDFQSCQREMPSISIPFKALSTGGLYPRGRHGVLSGILLLKACFARPSIVPCDR